MRRGLKLSIGALMRLIALFALELAMFQRVLFLIVIPPITMAIVSLNLAVLFAFRSLPTSMSNRIAGLLSGGLISIFVLVGYFVMTAGASNPELGFFGRMLGASMSDLAASRPDPTGTAASALRLVARLAQVAEIILLDLVGISIVWIGGWLDGRRPSARAVAEAPAS